MDYGHYNCRDYYISPHPAAPSFTNSRAPFPCRHESFDQLEERSRSPRTRQPKFPLLKLPLELRQQIFCYLLPCIQKRTEPNPLASHARNFSAVQKRVARGMVLPSTESRHKGDLVQHVATPTRRLSSSSMTQTGITPVVWQKGNIALLSVCRQLHDECAELLYGNNTFLLFITYSDITFRFSWLLKSGFIPNRRYNFLELLPRKYMALIKRVAVNIDHVDSYTGMIKFNVSGKGLTHGLRKQVQRLVDALQPPALAPNEDYATAEDGEVAQSEGRRLTVVSVRVSNGNAILDQIKSDVARQRGGAVKVSQDLEEMLEPFGDLRGVRDVVISGAVSETFASSLEQKMMSLAPLHETSTAERRLRDLDLSITPHLCVYGNDL